MRKILNARHERGWSKVDRECDLCHMEKRTEWHIETPRFVIADTLHGSPFILSKQHKDSLSEDDEKAARHLVDLMFDDWSWTVTIDQYPEHWHAHIVHE